MKTDITKYTLRDELRALLLKGDTIKVKTKLGLFNKIMDKYDELLIYDMDSVKWRKESDQKQNDLISAYRKGRVYFKGGFFFIENIKSVHTKDDESILVKFKDGTEQSFTEDFKWMREL